MNTQRRSVGKGVNVMGYGGGCEVVEREKMQMPQSLLKTNNDERCRNQSGTLNSFEYTNGPQHGQPFIIQTIFRLFLYCSDTALKKCVQKSKRNGENDGENPFKGTFFNFFPSLITSVDGLFTFLFNLMVFFIQQILFSHIMTIDSVIVHILYNVCYPMNITLHNYIIDCLSRIKIQLFNTFENSLSNNIIKICSVIWHDIIWHNVLYVIY